MEEHWSIILPPGGKWSGIIGRGRQIRLTTLEAGANVSAMLYYAKDPAERYNMPDTLKAQYTSRLTTGHVFMTDNGRALASIIEDSLGWHDPLGGFTTREWTDAQYGPTSYQEMRNDWLRSGAENFMVELMRCGLQTRDLIPPVNFFSKVSCGEDGSLQFDSNHCCTGASVVLRTEMELLLVLSNTPHPLDPSESYPSVPVKMSVSPAAIMDEATDLCVNHRPENRRAFENTWNHFVLTNEGGGGK